MSRVPTAGGFYGQAVAPYAYANREAVAAMSQDAPQVLINPGYYNTDRGRAELAQRQRDQSGNQLQELQAALSRQSQVVQEGGVVYSPDELAARRSAISAGQSALALTAPFVNAGLLDAEGATRAANQSLTDEFNTQRNVRKASADWSAIETASRGGYSQQQVASAVSDFQRVHGLTANLVPGFQAYMGNQAPAVSPIDYMPLQSRVMGSVPGLTPQEASNARQSFIQATTALSQPGVTKDDAAKMQAQFSATHPAFASQVGVPQAMTRGQLQGLSRTAAFSSAQDQAGPVPLYVNQHGEPAVNPGWEAQQKYKEYSATADHQRWLERFNVVREEIRNGDAQLKAMNPGKKPNDVTLVPQWETDMATFNKKSLEVAANRKSLVEGMGSGPSQPQPGSSPPPPVSRPAASVQKDIPQSFVNPTEAMKAFRDGKVTVGKPIVVAGRRIVLDTDGKPSSVKD